MSLSKLPNEIFALSLSMLSLSDQKNCMFVSRQWHSQSRVFVLQCVHIKTAKEFQHFFKQLKKFYNMQEPLGSLIRGLRLSSEVELTQVNFDLIPMYCPNLEQLNSAKGLWKHFSYTDDFRKWKYLQRYPKLTLADAHLALGTLQYLGSGISQLDLDSGIMNNNRTPVSIIDILLHTPNLKSLQLSKEAISDSFTMTLPQFECIDRLCPHLDTLSLSNIKCILFTGDLNSVRHVKVATKLRTLRLRNVQINHSSFLLYWGSKYRNIKTLEIDLTSSVQGVQMWRQLATMATQFSKLTKVISELGEWGALPRDAFLEGLHASGAQLLDISITQIHTSCSYRRVRHGFYFLLSRSASSLKRLEVINYWSTFYLKEDLLDPIGQCFNLEQLSLQQTEEGKETDFPIDYVLDACPRLKQLQLSRMNKISIRENRNRVPHQLENLSIGGTHVYPQLFDHLAARCPQLNTLNISNVGKQLDRTIQVNINMPNHVFKSITIDGLYLVEGLEGWHDRRKCSCIISLEEIWDQAKSTQHSPRKWYQLYSKYPEKWYHVHIGSKEKSPLLQQLNNANVRKIKKFNMTQKLWDQLEEEIDGCGVPIYGPKRKWYRDIHRGYFSVRCKSVDRFTFQEISLFEK